MDLDKPLRAITIDFWNTLYDSSGGKERDAERFEVVRREAERLGAVIQAGDTEAAHKATWSHFNLIWETEHRTPQTRFMVEYFWSRLGIAADEEALQLTTQTFCEGVLRHPPALLPGAKEALRALSKNHYIALISDTAFSPGRVLSQLMERDGIAGYFRHYSFSDETGVSKPHPKAFRSALSGVECAMEQTVHIGDIERTDIVGAKNIGMKAILFAGDPANRTRWNAECEPTLADRRAESWEQILDIIQSWENSRQ